MLWLCVIGMRLERLERLEVEVVMQYVQCNLPQSQSAYQRSSVESECLLWLAVLCQLRRKT